MRTVALAIQTAISSSTLICLSQWNEYLVQKEFNLAKRNQPYLIPGRSEAGAQTGEGHLPPPGIS